MKNEIEKETTKLKIRYKTSARHTLQVDFYTYKTELENEFK